MEEKLDLLDVDLKDLKNLFNFKSMAELENYVNHYLKSFMDLSKIETINFVFYCRLD
jgi:uncharacterized protein (UPF0264 family)